MVKNPELLARVREAYSNAAKSPQGDHSFPVGREFAEGLGYAAELLDDLPSVASEAFAGVSNVAVLAEELEDATVLDLGCGAGLDSLVAGRRLGSRGQVVGVDFSETMLGRAREAAHESGADNIRLLCASAEDLPLADVSVDVALVNGIFNLNPARESVFRELARVVRPTGRAYVAELILKEPLPPEVSQSEADWFA